MGRSKIKIRRIRHSGSRLGRGKIEDQRLRLAPGLRKAGLAVLLATFFVLNLSGIFFAQPHSPQPSGPGGVVTTLGTIGEVMEVTVQAGDTLWGLAAAYGPGNVDPRLLVEKIRKANDLKSPVIHPGQRLRLPR